MYQIKVKLPDGSYNSNCINFILKAPLSKIDILYKRIIDYIQEFGYTKDEIKQELKNTTRWPVDLINIISEYTDFEPPRVIQYREIPLVCVDQINYNNGTRQISDKKKLKNVPQLPFLDIEIS